jgi:hypothetical protein
MPTLRVACTAPQLLDVLVVTGLPAAVEQGDQRTVRLQFDEAEPAITTWVQSGNHQALIAPAEDARMVADRLSRSRRFRFAFLPFNAEPAVATFTLIGFEAHWREIQLMCPSPAS